MKERGSRCCFMLFSGACHLVLTQRGQYMVLRTVVFTQHCLETLQTHDCYRKSTP